MIMGWFFWAICSYLLNAAVVVIDKFLLTSRVKNPFVYAFYGGILGSFALVLWPLDFSFLSFRGTMLALSSGVFFLGATYFLFTAMNKEEASRVVSIIGGISPIVIFGLSYLILHERLSVFWRLAFVFLVSGGLLLTIKEDIKTHALKISRELPLYSFASAVFFGLTFFTTKLVFMETSFLNGFIWARAGTLIVVLVLISFPVLRKQILGSSLNISRGVSFFFVLNKGLSALAFLALNYSIMLGSVTMVNALQGVQYAFIFILALLFYFYKPKFLQESFSFTATVEKAAGIILVSAGVALLFYF